MNRYTSMSLCCALAILFVSGIASATEVKLAHADGPIHHLSADQKDPDLSIEIMGDMDFKRGGIWKLMGYHYKINRGTYSTNQSVIKGRKYILVPMTLYMDSAPVSRYSGGSTNIGCQGPYDPFAAVDPETGEILDRVIDQEGGCAGGTVHIDWGANLVPKTLAGVERRSKLSQEAASNAQAMRQGQARAAAVAMDTANEIKFRPKKQEIGAKLCRIEGKLRYTAFTEAVSPDNGKVQLRVVDASYIGAPNVKPGGWRPEITWDNPDNWKLCE